MRFVHKYMLRPPSRFLSVRVYAQDSSCVRVRAAEPFSSSYPDPVGSQLWHSAAMLSMWMDAVHPSMRDCPFAMMSKRIASVQP